MNRYGRGALPALAWLVGALTSLPVAAQAPGGTSQPTPGQPPIVQTPLLPSQQYRAPATAPTAPSSQPSAGAAGSVPPGNPPQTGPAIVPNIWLPQGGATLQALDKVNAQSAVLSVKVGQSAKFGSLVIAVQGCSIRPPDQPADAAAYLVVTDTHPDSPAFKGWMLKKEPQVNMLEHPIYDLRVTGCTP